jgi:hypothetical protein
MTNSQNSGSFPPRKHSWKYTHGLGEPSVLFRTHCLLRTHPSDKTNAARPFRLHGWHKTSQVARKHSGACAQDFQSSRRAWREYREAERIDAKSFGWLVGTESKPQRRTPLRQSNGAGVGNPRLSVNSFLRHRVGTFDAFLPCELDRRREATPSAAGPFLHVRGERASSYQTKIPFLVAATNTTAASTTTERQAQTQIAASSASDLGMCFVPGSSSCKHHRAWCRSTPQNHSDKNVHRRTKLSQGGFLPSLPCFGRSRLRPASPQLQKLTSARPGAGYVANTNRPYRSSSPLFTKCSESKQNSTYSPHSAPANPGRTSNH